MNRLLLLFSCGVFIFANSFACTSLTLTNKNATEPVMVGKINHLGAKKIQTKIEPYRIIEQIKTWHIINLFFVYLWQDSTEQNFEAFADVEYASVVERTRCTHRIQSVDYNTYSHFSLIYSAYMNKMKAESDGAVKCAR